MVRAEGARLRLAHTDASEPNATSALADERLIVYGRRSQDDATPQHGRGWSQDHGEALDDATQDHREARHGQARHREALHGEARRAQSDDAAP